jgi:uncharacterized YigZ family protein
MMQHHNSIEKHEWSINLIDPIQLIEKGSKFIGIAWEITDRSQLKDILQKVRSNHTAASHYCYGFQIGLGNSKVQGMSDDGEPKHTAGKPILQVLSNTNVTNTIVFVIRYFGGTELGTGGLVRMYTKTTQEVIASGTLMPLIPKVAKKFDVSYDYWKGIENYLKNSGYQYQSYYTDKVIFDLEIPEADLELVKKSLKDLSHGTISY